MKLIKRATIQMVNQRLMKGSRSLPEKPSNPRRRGMEWEWLQKYISNYQLNCLL
jgi:hypothetical protein